MARPDHKLSAVRLLVKKYTMGIFHEKLTNFPSVSFKILNEERLRFSECFQGHPAMKNLSPVTPRISKGTQSCTEGS